MKANARFPSRSSIESHSTGQLERRRCGHGDPGGSFCVGMAVPKKSLVQYRDISLYIASPGVNGMSHGASYSHL